MDEKHVRTDLWEAHIILVTHLMFINIFCAVYNAVFSNFHFNISTGSEGTSISVKSAILNGAFEIKFLAIETIPCTNHFKLPELVFNYLYNNIMDYFTYQCV